MIQRANNAFLTSDYYNSREALINQYGNFNCGEISAKIKSAQLRQIEARRKIRRLVDEQKTK